MEVTGQRIIKINDEEIDCWIIHRVSSGIDSWGAVVIDDLLFAKSENLIMSRQLEAVYVAGNHRNFRIIAFHRIN